MRQPSRVANPIIDIVVADPPQQITKNQSRQVVHKNLRHCHTSIIIPQTKINFILTVDKKTALKIRRSCAFEKGAYSGTRNLSAM